MKFINIIYFVLAVFILAFGIAAMVSGQGKTWANICILLIGLYFMYRGFAVTWNNRLRREEEQRRIDGGNDDPANA